VNNLSYKTVHANAQTVEHAWYIIDAEDKVLGRMASKIAVLLMGKHKPYVTKHVDCGDFIVVINAEKVRLTGKKLDQKESIHHTGHPGGQRSETARQLIARKPEKLVEDAIRDMLPKTKLGDAMYSKLFVYKGDKHPHAAQKPKEFKF
jgi:large subunit ribosomal protein L13